MLGFSLGLGFGEFTWGCVYRCDLNWARKFIIKWHLHGAFGVRDLEMLTSHPLPN